jgi:hypothetical protein
MLAKLVLYRRHCSQHWGSGHGQRLGVTNWRLEVMIGGYVHGSRLAVFRLACWLIEFGIEIPMKCGNGGMIMFHQQEWKT